MQNFYNYDIACKIPYGAKPLIVIFLVKKIIYQKK